VIQNQRLSAVVEMQAGRKTGDRITMAAHVAPSPMPSYGGKTVGGRRSDGRCPVGGVVSESVPVAGTLVFVVLRDGVGAGESTPDDS
jgi:hypothetical protein